MTDQGDRAGTRHSPFRRSSSSSSAEAGRTPLWLWPLTAAAVAVVAGVLLGRLRPAPGSTVAQWSWPGDHSSATTLLQVIATAAVTVTSLTFSLVMIALQLASQQFSPRLLRMFTRDPLTKAVLTTLVGTLVFSVATLRQIHADRPLPAVSVLVASVLGLAAVLALVLFLAHMSRVLRVDTMMVTVHNETREAIERFYLPCGATDPPAPASEVPASAQVVTAATSGFVQRIDVDDLVAAAAASCRLSVAVRPGDHVVLGTPLAWIDPPDAASEPLAAATRDAIQVAYERTLQQDASFGFRQLTDVAVKALSPGINDPVTAATAVGHMSDLLVRLTGRRLGPAVHGLGESGDAPGADRGVVLLDRDLRYCLDLMCGHVRRYGRREPTVLVALIRALRDVAAAARDDVQREELRRQAGLVVDEMDETLSPTDRAAVDDVAERLELALAGDLAAAFTDRAGETRSL